MDIWRYFSDNFIREYTDIALEWSFSGVIFRKRGFFFFHRRKKREMNFLMCFQISEI